MLNSPHATQVLSCEGCRGLCCGPVPVTKRELAVIKKHLRAMPPEARRALETQHRYFGTCIFYDLRHDKCGIHAVKPSICGAFGHYQNLICFRQPWAAANRDWIVLEMPAGVLSVDFTWRYFR